MTSSIEPRMRTDRMLASFHEAGHAIACLEFGIPMSQIVLQPALLADSCAGYVSFSWWLDQDTIKPRKDAVMSLAGGEAERIHRARNELGEPDTSRWETDLECARRACERGRLDFNDMRSQAFRLVSRRWGALTQVALMLDRRKRLSASLARGAARRAS